MPAHEPGRAAARASGTSDEHARRARPAATSSDRDRAPARPIESLSRPTADRSSVQSLSGSNGRSSAAKKPRSRSFTRVSRPSTRPTSATATARPAATAAASTRATQRAAPRAGSATKAPGVSVAELVRGDEREPDEQAGAAPVASPRPRPVRGPRSRTGVPADRLGPPAVRHSHHTSRPNDSASRASATARAPASTGRGSTSARRDGQHDALDRGDDLAPVPRRHRSAQPGQQPAGRDEHVARQRRSRAPTAPSRRATYTLSTRIRNASTSMSKRAPSADAVPVRRATQPSTASRTSATAASATRRRHRRRPRRASRRSARRRRRRAWPGPGSPGRPARAPRRRSRPRPQREARHVTTPHVDADEPARTRSRPTGPASAPSSAELADQPDHRTGLNRAHRASVSTGTAIARQMRRLPGSRRGLEGEAGVELRRCAFWLREPGVGRDPAGAAARARRRTRSSCARCAPGSAGAPRRWSSAAACPASQYAAMRAPFQEGDFPGPVKYGYLNVGVVEHGPPDAARPHGLLPLPAPDRLRRAGRGGGRRARRTCRRSGRCSPAPWRPRSTRCGTPRRWSATGSRSSAPGMVGCCVARLLAAVPRRPGHPRRRRPGPGRRSPTRSASTSRCRPTPPAAATSWCTPAPPPPGSSCSLDLLAPEGTVARPQLVRRRRGPRCRSAAPSTPGRLGIRASQVGTVAAGPRGPRTDGRPAGAGPRPAARPGLRRAAHRRVPLRRAARRDGPAGGRDAAGALPHHHLRRGVDACSA